jgi:hypothetical protein
VWEKYLSSIRDLPMAAKSVKAASKAAWPTEGARAEREFGILAFVADEVGSLHRSFPSQRAALHKPGF